MEISANYLWLLALCLIFVANGAVGHEDENKGRPLIETICKKAQDEKLCVDVLSTSPARNGDLQELAMLSLRVAANNAKEILIDVKTMIDDPDLDPGIQQGLADCKETLLDAQGQIADSVAATLTNANNDARTWLKAALAAIDTCDASIPGDDDILSVRSVRFRKLCSIALAISETIVAKRGPQTPTSKHAAQFAR